MKTKVILMSFLTIVISACGTTLKDLRGNKQYEERWVVQERISKAYKTFKNYSESQDDKTLFGEGKQTTAHFYNDSAEIHAKTHGNPLLPIAYYHIDLEKISDEQTEVLFYAKDTSWSEPFKSLLPLAEN